MKNLNLILEILKNKENSFEGDYYIPECWNSFGFSNYRDSEKREREISVNPYSFVSEAISHCISSCNKGNKGTKGNRINSNENMDLLKSIEKSVEITSSSVYSMLPRMVTAWNHYDEKLVPGTFLKAISLLPYLKKLNVNIIYLLPVFKYSDRNKKGEIGSPYSIKNIYSIDENLHDDLLGEDKGLVNVEFKAFVEACHALDMRVMVDFVFRTVSRDNDLILEHPDWFYWIDKSLEAEFKAPKLEVFNKPTCISPKSISKMYKSQKLEDFLKYFRYSPDKIDKKKWDDLVNRAKKTGENILQLIEEEFSLTTAPGFSDVINDEQPPWSDVTYLRIFFDMHKEATSFSNSDQPPYILYDIAKASIARGKQPNSELWEYIASVMPFYQEEYGIDGARIDMGHALPAELNEDMINRVKKRNPNFILWSEEFNAQNSKEARDSGFTFMTGGLWNTYRTIEKTGFYNRFMKDILDAKIPISAALETPDTPRAAFLYDSKKSLELMMTINAMIPNAVPFFNNGMEAMEIQPMNLGLGNTEEGKFVLPKKDAMYGKLAFFDNYAIHWTNEGFEFMERLYNDLRIIREKYKDLMNSNNYIDIKEQNTNRKILLLLYFDKKERKGIFLLANRLSENYARSSLKKLLPIETQDCELKVIYKNGNLCDESVVSLNSIILQPKEYIIGVLN